MAEPVVVWRSVAGLARAAAAILLLLLLLPLAG